MRLIVKEQRVTEGAIQNFLHKYMRCKSYALRKDLLICEIKYFNQVQKAPGKPKTTVKKDVIQFFLDEEVFDKNPKVSAWNNKGLCRNPSEVSEVMHTRFPNSFVGSPHVPLSL